MKVFLVAIHFLLYFNKFIQPYGNTFEDLFNDFKDEYNIEYETKQEERERFYIFIDNVKKIEGHNEYYYEEGLSMYRMGITRFADLTEEEFMQKVTTDYSHQITEDKFKNARPGSFFKRDPTLHIHKIMDWYRHGAVTDVKDEDTCESSWSFATVGTVEAQYFLRTGDLIPMSEQNLIDCTRPYGNRGCYGGGIENALTYIQQNGINSEEDYPYESKNDTCKFNIKESLTRVSGFMRVNNNENDLAAAVSTIGPVAVFINPTRMQLYMDGVFSCPFTENQTAVGRFMLLIGYTEEYWLLKNSWGEKWGERGYIRINKLNDTCNIAQFAQFPLYNLQVQKRKSKFLIYLAKGTAVVIVITVLGYLIFRK